MAQRIEVANEQTSQEIKQAVEEMETTIINSAGTNLNERTVLTTVSAPGEYSNVRLDITGKGVLHVIFNNHSSGAQMVVKIDDATHSFAIAANQVMPFFVGFNRNLKITSNGGGFGHVIYSIE